MSIDFKNLRDVQLGHTQNSILTNNQYGDFTNALFKAFDESRESKRDKETNSLYHLISNTSNSTVMHGLLSLGNGAVLTQYLQQTNDADDLIGYPLNPQQQKNNPTELFNEFLQSNIQTKIMNTMHSAKEKLQQQLEKYRATNDTNNEVVKMKLQQMEKNVSLLNSYLQPKTDEKELSGDDQLMQLLNNNAAYNKYLFHQK